MGRCSFEDELLLHTLFDAAGADLLTEEQLLAVLIREGYPTSVAECLPALLRAGIRTPRKGIYARPLPAGAPWPATS